MAMACSRLFTLPPLPPRPDFSVPRLRRRIALATVLPADFEYLRLEDFFFPGIRFLPKIRGTLRVRGCGAFQAADLDPIAEERRHGHNEDLLPAWEVSVDNL